MNHGEEKVDVKRYKTFVFKYIFNVDLEFFRFEVCRNHELRLTKYTNQRTNGPVNAHL